MTDTRLYIVDWRSAVTVLIIYTLDVIGPSVTVV